MSTVLAPAPRPRLTVAIIGLAVIAVLALLAAVVWLSQRAGGDEAPPPLPAFQPPVTASLPRFGIRSIEGGRAVLVADTAPGQSVDVTRDVPLDGSTRIEHLRAMSGARIQIGEWVTVIGVYNEVRNFSIRYLVVLPGDAALDADRIARSPLGFAGHESAKDGAERPILSGRVTAIEGGTLTLQRQPAEDISLAVTEESRVFALEPGDASALQPGGRAAVNEAGGQPALLVEAP